MTVKPFGGPSSVEAGSRVGTFTSVFQRFYWRVWWSLRRRWEIPRVGHVRFGQLGRLEPISRSSGFDRGRPIDRYYIEAFLDRYRLDISGVVLEVGDDLYTQRFGGTRVATSDVLHFTPDNPKATIIADLAVGEIIPSGRFDCVVLTQTLQYSQDLPAALRTIERVLRPGGVVLATVPGFGPISRDEWSERWCWGFTSTAVRGLFDPVFGAENVAVEAFGNVLTATCFAQGLAVEDVSVDALDKNDALYPVVVTVRAVKAQSK